MRAWPLLLIAGCHHSPGASPDAPPVVARTCPAPAAGPLCGPADSPCRIATDEPIANPWSSSFELLMDCDDRPALLFGASGTSTRGAVAIRDDSGAWPVQPMPIDAVLASGAF